MKFKRSDLGLYFASTLVGAGVGLLMGAFIASRQTRSFYVPGKIEEWEAVSDPVAQRFQVDNVEEYLDEQAEKNARVKKPRKTSTKITVQDDPKLAAFIAEWEPSTIQIEMVKKGLVTLEALEEVLIKEAAAKKSEPYNYRGPYYDDKPELVDISKLPEEEKIVDDRYQILRDLPTDRDIKKVRIIYWDPEDNDFYCLSRSKQPVPTDLRGLISDETWEIMLPYFDKGYNTLYVDDKETNRFYRFDVIPDDMGE